MCALLDDQSVVLDRETDQEKSPDPSGPRIRCPLCGWSPRKDDHWSCSCGHQWKPLIPGECARHASTIGLQRTASLVPAGRRTPTGMRSHEVQSRCDRAHSRSVNEELKIASGL